MPTMTHPVPTPRPAPSSARVTGGVDTHKDTHTAAVLDAAGRLLGHRQFPTTSAGYALLLTWLRSHGELDKVGIEGTGAYGAGLAKHLQLAGVTLVEIDRPDRKTRRWQGKSDPGRATARLLRAHHPVPAQPRRRPPGQRCAAPHRAVPAALGPPHPRLRRPAHHPGHEQERDHPLPQTLPRPGDLHRPAHTWAFLHPGQPLRRAGGVNVQRPQRSAGRTTLTPTSGEGRSNREEGKHPQLTQNDLQTGTLTSIGASGPPAPVTSCASSW